MCGGVFGVSVCGWVGVYVCMCVCVCGVRVGICMGFRGGCAHLSVCRGSGSRMVRCVAECV